MMLSILIPTLVERRKTCAILVAELKRQINGRSNLVEIIQLEDNRERTTGAKRNELVLLAAGEYVVFFDDDDWPARNYIDTILEAAKKGSDAIAINGYITTNGSQKSIWRISKDNPYQSIKEAGRTVYLRFNNHISPIKRSIALQYKFPDCNYGEDYAWALQIHEARAVKTEAKTTGEIYHYRYTTIK